MKIVQVTKANSNRDRGFIAVDAICSAFENRESGKTDIMTMDGYWYEVLDDIEKLRDAVVGKKQSDNEKPCIEEEAGKEDGRIKSFFKKYKVTPNAIAENGGKPPYERSEPVVEEVVPNSKPYPVTHTRHGKYGRYGRGKSKPLEIQEIVWEPGDSNDLSAVSDKGQSGDAMKPTEGTSVPSVAGKAEP